MILREITRNIIAMEFVKGIYVPLWIKQNDFGDPFPCHRKVKMSVFPILQPQFSCTLY